MTTARLIEYRITRDLIRKRELAPAARATARVERVITVAAVTAGMLLLGSYLQELLWVALAAAGVLALGTGSPEE